MMKRKLKLKVPSIEGIILIILVALVIANSWSNRLINIKENTTMLTNYQHQYEVNKEKEIAQIENILSRVNRSLPDSKISAYANAIWNSSEKYSIEAKLFLCIVIMESGAKDYVISSAGAIGVAQIMPFHINMLISKGIFNNQRDFYDGVKSIEAGAYIYSIYYKWAKGDNLKASAAYNAGPGNWRKGLGYAGKVLRIQEKYW